MGDWDYVMFPLHKREKSFVDFVFEKLLFFLSFTAYFLLSS